MVEGIEMICFVGGMRINKYSIVGYQICMASSVVITLNTGITKEVCCVDAEEANDVMEMLDNIFLK